MWPCESSQTPWVLPYLSCGGSWPQSWMASYWWPASPTMGGLLPDLSVVPRAKGAAAAIPVVARKFRRVIVMCASARLIVLAGEDILIREGRKVTAEKSRGQECPRHTDFTNSEFPSAGRLSLGPAVAALIHLEYA